MTGEVLKAAQVVWDYMHYPCTLHRADCIIGFGNFNTDIARRAAELYLEGYASKVLFTGGLGRNTLGLWQESEAQHFAAAAIEMGVPESDILLETKSTNSAENILFSRQLLEERGVPYASIIGVHQPFMERRLYAAFGVRWPEAELMTTSPQVDIPTYLAHAEEQGITEKAAIDVMVGDLQRMKVYAERGWQIPMEIPSAVWETYERLVAFGYGSQLAK